MHFIETFLNYFEYIFWFILVFTIIVFIHEFGHYYIAKINNVEIEKFSIGFGPILFSRVDKFNTKWQIGAIPLGGYVKFAGEMYADKKNNQNSKLNNSLFMNKKALQKASIVFAGPAANFLLSFFIFIFIFLVFGKNYTPSIIGSIDKNSPAERSQLKTYDRIISINNKKINSFEDIYQYIENKENFKSLVLEVERNNLNIDIKLSPQKKIVNTFIGTQKSINYLGVKPLVEPIVGKVFKNSPAEKAGLLKNDQIVEIDRVKIIDARQVIDIIKNNLNNEIEISILRNDKIINKNLIPYDLSKDKKGKIGISFKKSRKKLNLFEALREALLNIYEISIKTLIAFSEILFGKRHHCEVGGPILIAKVSNDVANADLVSFVVLIGLISINLGLINLFPLPLLDGGHLLTFLSEFIVGKNLNYNLFKIIQVLGVIIIISFMSFSIINDIYCRVLN